MKSSFIAYPRKYAVQSVCYISFGSKGKRSRLLEWRAHAGMNEQGEEQKVEREWR